MAASRKGLLNVDVPVFTVDEGRLDTLTLRSTFRGKFLRPAPRGLALEIRLPKVQGDRIRVMVSDNRLAVGYADSPAHDEPDIVNAVGPLLQLPAGVDVNDVRARFSKGVLTVMLGLPGEPGMPLPKEPITPLPDESTTSLPDEPSIERGKKETT